MSIGDGWAPTHADIVGVRAALRALRDYYQDSVTTGHVPGGVDLGATYELLRSFGSNGVVTCDTCGADVQEVRTFVSDDRSAWFGERYMQVTLLPCGHGEAWTFRSVLPPPTTAVDE